MFKNNLTGWDLGNKQNCQFKNKVKKNWQQNPMPICNTQQYIKNFLLNISQKINDSNGLSLVSNLS